MVFTSLFSGYEVGNGALSGYYIEELQLKNVRHRSGLKEICRLLWER